MCELEGEEAKLDGRPPIRCSALELEFSTRLCRFSHCAEYITRFLTVLTAAEQFLRNLQAMQRELFILYLQYSLWEEQVVFQRYEVASKNLPYWLVTTLQGRW